MATGNTARKKEKLNEKTTTYKVCHVVNYSYIYEHQKFGYEIS